MRPEDLTLHAGESTGVVARVIHRCFYGHDLLSEVRLDSGVTLRVRVLGPTDRELGADVRVRLATRECRLFSTAGERPTAHCAALRL